MRGWTLAWRRRTAPRYHNASIAIIPLALWATLRDRTASGMIYGGFHVFTGPRAVVLRPRPEFDHEQGSFCLCALENLSDLGLKFEKAVCVCPLEYSSTRPEHERIP